MEFIYAAHRKHIEFRYEADRMLMCASYGAHCKYQRFPWVAMPDITNTYDSLGRYAWHCKYIRFRGSLCLALQILTIPRVAMPGIANTDDSLVPYAWHCKYLRFLGSLSLALQKQLYS